MTNGLSSPFNIFANHNSNYLLELNEDAGVWPSSIASPTTTCYPFGSYRLETLCYSLLSSCPWSATRCVFWQQQAQQTWLLQKGWFTKFAPSGTQISLDGFLFECMNFSLYSFAFPSARAARISGSARRRACWALDFSAFKPSRSRRRAMILSAMRSLFFFERSFSRVPRLVVLLRGSERGWAVQQESDLWTTGTCSIKLIKWTCWTKDCRASGELRLRI